MDEERIDIRFTWEDDETAGVSTSICSCGYDFKLNVVSTGHIITCPKCEKKIIFKWGGMGFAEMKEKE